MPGKVSLSCLQLAHPSYHDGGEQQNHSIPRSRWQGGPDDINFSNFQRTQLEVSLEIQPHVSTSKESLNKLFIKKKCYCTKMIWSHNHWRQNLGWLWFERFVNTLNLGSLTSRCFEANCRWVALHRARFNRFSIQDFVNLKKGPFIRLSTSKNTLQEEAKAAMNFIQFNVFQNDYSKPRKWLGMQTTWPHGLFRS